MPLTMCPQCDHEFIVPGRPVRGQRVICPACAARLKVVWLEPCELDWDDEPPESSPPSAQDASLQGAQDALS